MMKKGCLKRQLKLRFKMVGKGEACQCIVITIEEGSKRISSASLKVNLVTRGRKRRGKKTHWFSNWMFMGLMSEAVHSQRTHSAI